MNRERVCIGNECEWRGVGVNYHIQSRLGKKGSEKRWAKEGLILITGE